MRSVPSSIYTKEYYLQNCLGHEEFVRNPGKTIHPRVSYLLSYLNLKKGMRILDVGCGRGDLALYCAKKGLFSVGIDYSKAAINIAKDVLKKQETDVKKHVKFLQMDAKKLHFPEKTFDAIISIDVFEHLYKEELEVSLRQTRKILKDDGVLLVHTEANKIFLNFTHPYFVYPVSELLIRINKFITKKDYPGIPKDPRNDLHKKQHVNEPTHAYLKDLFKRHDMEGKIIPVIGGLKPVLSWKDRIYNIIVMFYPFCYLFPFHYLFAYDYICVMKKKR